MPERLKTSPAVADHAELFTPIRTANAFEQAIERIGRAIKMGLLRPGERLPPERDLAAQLALSRSTVREALRVLSDAGYLEARRGRGGGTFVAERLPKLEARDPGDIVRELGPRLPDLLTFRGVLELGAVELAAERATPEDCAGLAGLIDRVAKVHADDYREYRLRDVQLHLAIARVAGSPELLRVITEVHGALSELLQHIPRSDETLRSSDAQHRRILAAISGHDRDAARVVMREHVEGMERLMAGLVPSA